MAIRANLLPEIPMHGKTTLITTNNFKEKKNTF